MAIMNNIRNTFEGVMPDINTTDLNSATEQLQALGNAIHLQRKKLKVSVTSAAESAGVSRVTWHRMENGEPSVSAGAYMAALAVLGLRCVVASADVSDAGQLSNADTLPLAIPLRQYPQLKLLAWQVHDVDSLPPRDAWSLYQRNWRHVEQDKLQAHEAELIRK